MTIRLDFICDIVSSPLTSLQHKHHKVYCISDTGAINNDKSAFLVQFWPFKLVLGQKKLIVEATFGNKR